MFVRLNFSVGARWGSVDGLGDIGYMRGVKFPGECTHSAPDSML